MRKTLIAFSLAAFLGAPAVAFAQTTAPDASTGAPAAAQTDPAAKPAKTMKRTSKAKSHKAVKSQKHAKAKIKKMAPAATAN